MTADKPQTQNIIPYNPNCTGLSLSLCLYLKVEPEEDILGLEMDENFEPRMEDLLEEEQDHREDRTIQDEEWEPEFKRPKIKREPVEPGMFYYCY